MKHIPKVGLYKLPTRLGSQNSIKVASIDFLMEAVLDLHLQALIESHKRVPLNLKAFKTIIFIDFKGVSL